MAIRRVTRTGKDNEGDITALCHPGEEWSPRSKDDAIRDIDRGVHSYYVLAGGHRVEVVVVDGPNGKHLRTNPDTSLTNNLDELPDC